MQHFLYSGDAKLRRYLQQHPTLVGEIKGEFWRMATHITHRLLEFIPVWVIFRCLNKIKQNKSINRPTFLNLTSLKIPDSKDIVKP